MRHLGDNQAPSSAVGPGNERIPVDPHPDMNPAGPVWLRRAPTIVLAAVGAWIAGAWTASIAVDVFDVLGTRASLFEHRSSEYPYLFYHLFAEGRPVEWLQWSLLVVAAVAVAICAGRRLESSVRATAGLALLSLTFGMLAVKDAGNPRHMTAATAESLAGSAAGTFVELFFFGAVALLALLALRYSWIEIRHHRRARSLLLGGYGCYAVAGLKSASSDLWYHNAGRFVLDDVAGGRLLSPPSAWESGLLPWVLFDALVEETVELVAAALVAAAALALLRDLVPARPSGEGSDVSGRRDAPLEPGAPAPAAPTVEEASRR